MMRLLLALMMLCWGGAAAAAESAAVHTARTTATLVSDTDFVAPGTAFRVALLLRLAPGWHTYWKNPGDAGVAPDLTFTLQAGASAGPIAWPMPRRVAEGPLMTYAYTGDVLLPVQIKPSDAPQAAVIEAHAQWLVCKEICIPEEGDFRLELPVGKPNASAQSPLFAAFDRQAPRPSPWPAVVSPDGMLWVSGPELTPTTVTDAWFIPDASGTIRDSDAQPLTVREGGFLLALRPGQKFQAATGLSGLLAVRDRTGLETYVTLHASPGSVPLASPTLPLPRILGLALLGGLILNLMPCVFPVLALKVVALAGAARGTARWQAAAYTIGVLVAFTALGGALLFARAAGAAAGWGFQFASPVFVAAMAWLLFMVGLNLSGVFQIGSGLSGAGHRFTVHGGLVGSFFTGLLAVVVATPCTAPFMGVAIAAGLAAPPVVTFLVFLAMGLGLAAPYALVASIPFLARLTPRPGRWMELLRQALAFPMYGASAWLVWVISEEAGSAGVLGVSVGFILLSFAAWVLGISQSENTRARRVGQSAATAAVLASLAVLSGIATTPPAPPDSRTEAGIEPFTPARLAELRAQGRPVFVNMTAAWCVTCLVNERVAIATDPVQRAFAQHHVAYLKGDWTRQDPGITAYLRANGRDGVPLYVYYPPRDGEPMLLPQILTEATLLDRLNPG